MQSSKSRFIALLRWSERYTKTDMVYIAVNGFWLNLNYIVTTLLAFLLSIAFANLLPKETYGTYQYLLSLAAVLSALTYSGFTTAITKSVAQGFEGTFLSSIRPQLLWNIVPALATIAWSSYYFIHGNVQLGVGTAIIAITLPLTSTFNSYIGYFAGKQDYKRQAIYSLMSSLVYYAAIFFTLYIAPHAIVLIAVNLVVTSLTAIFFHLRTARKLRPDLPVDTGAGVYARHISVMNVMGILAAQIDKILVFHFLGAASLAIYSIAILIPEKLNGIFKAITLTAFPRFAQRSLQEVRDNLTSRLWIFSSILLAAALAYALFAPFFFRAVYPAYLSALPYSQVYGLFFITSLATPLLAAFMGHEKVNQLYIVNAGLPIIQVLLQILLLLQFGLWGLIGARILGALITAGTSFFLFKKVAGSS